MLSPSITKNNIIQEVLVTVMYLLIKNYVNSHTKSQGMVLVKYNNILLSISRSPDQISVWGKKKKIKKTNKQKPPHAPTADSIINKMGSFPTLFSFLMNL